MTIQTNISLILKIKDAICVQSFNVSLILQFTSRIAFRCVLHRYENQDIHCWNYLFYYNKYFFYNILFLKKLNDNLFQTLYI